MKYIVIPLWIFIVVYLMYNMFKHIKMIRKDDKKNPMINKIKFWALVTQIPLAIVIATIISYKILFSFCLDHFAFQNYKM